MVRLTYSTSFAIAVVRGLLGGLQHARGPDRTDLRAQRHHVGEHDHLALEGTQRGRPPWLSIEWRVEHAGRDRGVERCTEGGPRSAGPAACSRLPHADASASRRREAPQDRSAGRERRVPCVGVSEACGCWGLGTRARPVARPDRHGRLTSSPLPRSPRDADEAVATVPHRVLRRRSRGHGVRPGRPAGCLGRRLLLRPHDPAHPARDARRATPGARGPGAPDAAVSSPRSVGAGWCRACEAGPSASSPTPSSAGCSSWA